LYRIQKLLDVKYDLTEIPGLEPTTQKPKFEAGKSNGRKGPNIRHKRRGRSYSSRKPGGEAKRSQAA